MSIHLAHRTGGFLTGISFDTGKGSVGNTLSPITSGLIRPIGGRDSNESEVGIVKEK